MSFSGHCFFTQLPRLQSGIKSIFSASRARTILSALEDALWEEESRGECDRCDAIGSHALVSVVDAIIGHRAHHVERHQRGVGDDFFGRKAQGARHEECGKVEFLVHKLCF